MIHCNYKNSISRILSFYHISSSKMVLNYK